MTLQTSSRAAGRDILNTLAYLAAAAAVLTTIAVAADSFLASALQRPNANETSGAAPPAAPSRWRAEVVTGAQLNERPTFIAPTPEHLTRFQVPAYAAMARKHAQEGPPAAKPRASTPRRSHRPLREGSFASTAPATPQSVAATDRQLEGR